MHGEQSSREIFNETLHKTDLWLRDISTELDCSMYQAHIALRATLQALRERLPADELAHFSSHLPTLLRGVLFEGWQPNVAPVKAHGLNDFLAMVSANSRGAFDKRIERTVLAVLKVISNRVSEGEVVDLIGCMPQDIQEFWARAS